MVDYIINLWLTIHQPAAEARASREEGGCPANILLVVTPAGRSGGLFRRKDMKRVCLQFHAATMIGAALFAASIVATSAVFALALAPLLG